MQTNLSRWLSVVLLEYGHQQVLKSWLRQLVAGAALGVCVTPALPATVTPQTNQIRSAPTLVGYNAGHFYPGSNTRDWWRYSGATGARVFINPADFEPTDDLAPWGDNVTDQASFLARRDALCADPLNTNYINWPAFTNRYETRTLSGVNRIQLNYALAQLRDLGVRILVNISAGESTLPIRDASDWAGKWELWQHYYAQAFYLARHFGVQRFQMFNEPNHSSNTSVTQSEYLMRLQLAADAIQSAIADVNRLQGKSLTPTVLAPVTSGSADGSYPAWGRLVVTNRHVNYLGQIDTNLLLVQKYDYHQYNSAPDTFGDDLTGLRVMLSGDLATEPCLPITISEFNVHTAATFDSMTETLDSPSKYARLGAILVSLTRNGIDEMYCFKFSQTPGETGSVKKNGMHFVENQSAPYNVGGVTQAGEVFRLFSKAFRPGRTLLDIAVSSAFTGPSLLASYDAVAQRYYLFSANYSSNEMSLNLDLSCWGMPTTNRWLLEEVGELRSGGGRAVGSLTSAGVATDGTQTNLAQPANSVWLFTFPARRQLAEEVFLVVDDATVKDGANANANYGSSTALSVNNNSTNAAGRAVAFLKFRLPAVRRADIELALLSVHASTLNGASTAQAHVYGLTNNTWSQGTITWSTAPDLAQGVPAGDQITNNFVHLADTADGLLGQFVAVPTVSECLIDVTDFLQSHPDQEITFLLAREARFAGDRQDDGGMEIVSSEAGLDRAPRLRLIRAAEMRPRQPKVSATDITNGQWQMVVTGESGPDYTIQASTNLQEWLSVFTTNSPPLPFTWAEVLPAEMPVRFYRVLLGP